MKAFTAFRTNGDGGLVDRMFATLETVLGGLREAVTNDRIVTQTLVTGVNRVFHGLGAPVKTWEIVDKDTDSNVWRSADATTSPALFVVLEASAPVTVKIRFT